MENLLNMSTWSRQRLCRQASIRTSDTFQGQSIYALRYVRVSSRLTISMRPSLLLVLGFECPTRIPHFALLFRSSTFLWIKFSVSLDERRPGSRLSGYAHARVLDLVGGTSCSHRQSPFIVLSVPVSASVQKPSVPFVTKLPTDIAPVTIGPPHPPIAALCRVRKTRVVSHMECMTGRGLFS